MPREGLEREWLGLSDDKLLFRIEALPADHRHDAVLLAVVRSDRHFFVRQEAAKRVTDRTRLLILNSPGNPTGGVIPPEDLARIARIVLKHRDLVVLSDEIYSRILFDGRHASIASIPGMREHTIVLDGFSKTYAMTGWPLGRGVMPIELTEHITRLQTNANSCVAGFVQSGLTARTVGDTMTAAVENWEQLVYVTPTATGDGVWEFYVDCDGTAGYINVDDWSAA